MKTSETITEISKAYVACAPKMKNMPKDSKGSGYTYTSLEKLIEATKPILADHGLAVLQFPTGNGIITRLIHDSGEWFEIETESDLIQLKGMNAYQVQGSQITYLRRYAWASICGIASDEDNDAAGEQVNASQTHQTTTSNRKVSPKQVKLIQFKLSKLKDREANESALKDFYKISRWNELPSTAMDGLMKWFEKNGV